MIISDTNYDGGAELVVSLTDRLNILVTVTDKNDFLEI